MTRTTMAQTKARHSIAMPYVCPRCDVQWTPPRRAGVLLTQNGAAWWTCGTCDGDFDVTDLVTIRWPHS